MPKIYSSKQLLRKAAAVTAFIEAAEAYRTDRADEGLKRRVAGAAGRAHDASDITGTTQVHTAPPAVGGRSVAYDPIANWDSVIDPFVDQLVIAIDAAHQIRGTLEAMAEDSAAEERSLVGRMARLVSFAGRVRSYLAARGYSQTTQTLGFITAIFAQTLGTVLAALVIWLLAEFGLALGT